MGTVHLAEVAEAAAGLEPGQQVAVKIVHPHLLSSPGFFKRFLREAELGRKVVHENVVRTIDVDALLVDDTQVNFMVMEYVAGKSLRQLLIDLGTIPETLLREIALQTAAGLASIHEAGIVHRDLKPENILITDDHQIRIMDLGVAKLQEASIAITTAGQFAGSVLYAAPEHFGPEEVGPSVDLYSLGVTLYELATGGNPFQREDAASLIDAHLHLHPPRIAHLKTETTGFLSELVATLLAKQPAERFESAKALHEVLAEAERSRWWIELAPKLRKKGAHLPRIRVRRETELHGRNADLKALNEAWERAKNGEGNTVFIEGEAGIGKTRLIDAFLRGLKDKDLHVLYGSYPPSGGLGGISEAIIEKFGEAMLADALAPYVTVTPSLLPAFAAVVKHESLPTGAEPLSGEAFNAVCVHSMRALAEERPLIWIVENLDFAPQESRDTVLALARAVEDHRVLLVPTARPGLAEDTLAHFSRLENFQRRGLGRLGGRDIVRLLADAFQSDALAEKLGGKIAVKSDGVPFFVFEMIRGLKEGEFIRQLPDGSYVQTQVIDAIEVPSAVRDLIGGRMRGLTVDQRAILDAGAVQGMSFEPALVAQVLEEKKVRVLRQIAEIERRFGLVRGEATFCTFDQNQIQEVLYQDLLPELRSEYHTLLAEAYAERLEGEPTGEDATFLASNHLRGSRPKESLEHLMPALEHLEKSYRNEAAIELAARALEARGLLEGKERAEVLLKKAGRHGLRGEREPERTALDEALALADSGEDPAMRARVRVSLGWYLIRASDLITAQECSELALVLASEADDKKIEASATGNLGTVFFSQGRHGEARASFEKHLALSREIGDRAGEARATGNLGTVFFSQGRYEEARAQYEKHLALSREMGDRAGEAIATGNLGSVFRDQGRLEEARAHFEKSLALLREIGHRQGEAAATGNLGTVFFSQGRHEEARAHHERHLALSREMGGWASEAIATGNLGTVFFSQGRYEEARASFEKHLALSRGIGDRAGEARATGNLGTVFFSQGRYEEARAHHEKHLALSREIGDRRQEGYALGSLASLADAEGDAETALRLLGAALALRRELGEKGNVAESLVALGGIELEQGDLERAVAYLDEALTLAREVNEPGTILLATVHRARLSDGDPEAALAAFREHEGRVGHDTKLEARFRLWELTKDETHLAEVKRLLDFAVDGSPEDYRTSMIENVPLHRDIMRAWEEHGAKDES
jgi:tetratricopeptide (TPR) repeat protein